MEKVQESIRLVGKRVKFLRESRGCTRKELGEAIGRTERMIDYYESGSRVCSLPVLFQIARYFGVPVQWFFEEKSEKNKQSLHTETDSGRKVS